MTKYIVIDLNQIRGTPSDQVLDLPSDMNAVFPHVILAEICKSNIPDAQAYKLQEFFESYPSQLYVGHEWLDLVDQDLISRQCCGAGAIHQGFSWPLQHDAVNRTLCVKEGVSWLKDSPEMKTYENKGKFFLGWCQTIAAYLESREPEVLSNLEKDGVNWCLMEQEVNDCSNIVGATGVFAGLLGERRRKYKNKDWQHALKSHPDRFAMGRWVKLLLWYGYLWASKSNKDKFKNNWDDMQYLFLASYLGAIATDDKGICRCSKSLFPHVSVKPLPYRKLIM